MTNDKRDDVAGKNSAAGGYKTAFIGGVIGAVATALVGGAIALLPAGGSAITAAIVGALLNHLTVELRQGGSTNNSDFIAHCEKGEKVVGGVCTITSGNGVIQNEGTTPDNGFGCTYSRRADPQVTATIYAACLKRI
jgi:hypothetical protein